MTARPTCLPNALIPRGPLICSNIENLENYRIPSERSFYPNNNNNNPNNNPILSNKYKLPVSNNFNNTESSNSSLEYTGTSNYLTNNYDFKTKTHIAKICNMTDFINDKKSLAMPEETADIDFNISFNNINNYKSQLYSETISAEHNNKRSLVIESNRHSNRLHSLNQIDKTFKNTSCNHNSKSLEDSCFINNLDTYGYYGKKTSKTNTLKPKQGINILPILKNNELQKSNKAAKNYTDEISSVFRNRNDSDYDLDDFIEESLLSDAFSSNEEDNDMFIKLKLKEEERVNMMFFNID